MCGETDKTISHIVSEYKKLSHKQYRYWRPDKVAQVVQWDLCGKLGYDRDEKYYNFMSHIHYQQVAVGL